MFIIVAPLGFEPRLGGLEPPLLPLQIIGQYMRMQRNRTTISKSLNLAATIATTLSFYCCGGSTRTRDLQVMSLTSYHCSTPRYCAFFVETHKTISQNSCDLLNKFIFNKIPNGILPPALPFDIST